MFGNPTAGNNETYFLDQHLALRDREDNIRILLDRRDGGIFVQNVNGKVILRWNPSRGNLSYGGHGQDGDLVLFRKDKEDIDEAREASFLLDSDTATLWGGGGGADGKIVLQTKSGNQTSLEHQTIYLDGGKRLLQIKNDLNKISISLDGNTGNITCNDCFITGADFAEDFDIAIKAYEKVEPGTVMVLGEDGCLVESSLPYDKKVAGIISGAGKYKPGIVLDKQPEATNRLPVALSGKVICKVDASYGEIEIGDLLTTSETMGFAMKATDQSKAFGAVIGKALGTLKSGKGLIPVLVSLQ